MPHPDGFKTLPPVGAVMYGAVPLANGIAFYPELYYHGLPVWPASWCSESAEPIVRCEAMPQEGQLDDEYFQCVLQHSTVDHRNNRLLADGWAKPDKFVYSKYVHVDDLEKIEGPPPDGPF